jgi:hypothetical protein
MRTQATRRDPHYLAALHRAERRDQHARQDAKLEGMPAELDAEPSSRKAIEAAVVIIAALLVGLILLVSL